MPRPEQSAGAAETLQLRTATPADGPAVEALLDELGYPGTGSFVADHLRALGTSAIDEVLVAESGGELLGVLAFHLTPVLMYARPFARITALSVTADARGRGVGRALLERAETEAREAGAMCLEVTCSMRRTGAHAFYTRMGMEEYPKYFRKEFVSR
jgi:predicted N-acetyltransferase YhbS